MTSKLPSTSNLKVHFILSDIDAAQIQAELNFVFQSTEVLLLLRHIGEIKIHSRNDRDIVLQKTIPNADSITSLIRSESKKRSERSWLLHAVNIEVPAQVHDAVQSLSAAECPEKIKQATVISLTFAALIQDDQLMGMEKARIYCYLPTQVCAGLPYLVNADFILNQDRSLLMNNIWNRFLLNAIAYEQFIWLGRLANNPRWKTSILNLLALPSNGGYNLLIDRATIFL